MENIGAGVRLHAAADNRPRARQPICERKRNGIHDSLAPVWLLKKPDDFDAYLAEQLKRLQTDHIDFYLLHALNAPRWAAILGLDVLRKAESAVRDGRIGHFGFSFHDNFETLKKIVKGRAFGSPLARGLYVYGRVRRN